MPFVTSSQLVDDDEYVKYHKDYVIARKLYVWMDAPFPDDDVFPFLLVSIRNDESLMNATLV